MALTWQPRGVERPLGWGGWGWGRKEVMTPKPPCCESSSPGQAGTHMHTHSSCPLPRLLTTGRSVSSWRARGAGGLGWGPVWGCLWLRYSRGPLLPAGLPTPGRGSEAGAGLQGALPLCKLPGCWPPPLRGLLGPEAHVGCPAQNFLARLGGGAAGSIAHVIHRTESTLGKTAPCFTGG